MLEADQAPTFSHRRVDADVAGVVQQVQLAVADDAPRKGVQIDAILELESLDQRSDLIFLVADDRMMQTETYIGRFAGGEAGEPCDGQSDALSFVGPFDWKDEDAVPLSGAVWKRRC